MHVVLAGRHTNGLQTALGDADCSVEHIDIVDRSALDDADIESADVYLLTDMEQATTIAVAKDCNPDVRVVVYDDAALPDFASRQTDVAVDPALVDPETVVETLTDGDA
ncbi:MAG: CTP synthetase [Halococcoides sp.]